MRTRAAAGLSAATVVVVLLASAMLPTRPQIPPVRQVPSPPAVAAAPGTSRPIAGGPGTATPPQRPSATPSGVPSATDPARPRPPAIHAVRTDEASEEREGSGNIDERAAWFFGQRAYPNVQTPLAALERAVTSARALPRVTRIPTRPTQGPDATGPAGTPVTWTALGPRPIGAISYPGDPRTYIGKPPWSGRVTAIAPHPTNADVIYLGTANGGVWKTTDGGTHWDPLAAFDALPSLSIGALAIDPRHPRTIYAGTGEPNTGDAYYGAGLFRSKDAGATWSKLGSLPATDCFIPRIIVDPNDSATIFVVVHAAYGMSRGATNCVKRNGVYRSTNSGGTWTRVLYGTGDPPNGFPIEYPTDLEVDATRTPITWYAGFAGTGGIGGVYRSTRHGAFGSWRLVTGSRVGGATGRVELATGGGRVYAAMEEFFSGGLLGIFRSDDRGTTWSPKLPSQKPHGSTNSGFCDLGYGGQCGYDLTLGVSPTNGRILYAGGIKLFKYTNAGAAYTDISGPYGARTPAAKIHVDMHAIAFDASRRLWVGNDGGVYRSSDGGSTFQDMNGTLSLSQFYPGISGGSAGPLIGGLQDNGTVLYRGSASWKEAAAGDGGYTAIDPTDSDVMYTTYPGGYVYQTVDGGATQGTDISQFFDGTSYSNICSTISDDDCLFIFPLRIDPTDPHRLYAGSRYLWRGTGTPDTFFWDWSWETLNANAFSSTISAIGPTRNPSIIYVGLSGDDYGSQVPTDLRVTKNGGTTWAEVSQHGLPNRSFTDIVTSPTRAYTAYVTNSGFGTGHVWLTTNAGTTWTNRSGNLPDAPVNGLAVDWRTTPARLYAATDVGLFASFDGGTTWARYGIGMPNAVVMDAIIDTTADQVIAATHGRGMFTAPISTGIVSARARTR